MKSRRWKRIAAIVSILRASKREGLADGFRIVALGGARHAA